METTVITTIITVMGVATITMLGYFMQSVRAEMRRLGECIDRLDEKTDTRFDALEAKTDKRFDALEAKTDKRFGVLEEKVNALTASVAAIAATQTAHGNKLNHMVNLGERISAVEGAVFNKPATKLALAASIEPNE
ncbi:MAG: hypothetical protein KTU85_12855 [Acidimicrobiia bacterium]|nr:hypothetical protein [Acidimicrobiia bacterium]MCY4457633.1 hypothetical protein [Acidimicrobiaceae bacterium]